MFGKCHYGNEFGHMGANLYCGLDVRMSLLVLHSLVSRVREGMWIMGQT